MSDVLFYRFLLTIGLMPRKSKILGQLRIPICSTSFFAPQVSRIFIGYGKES